MMIDWQTHGDVRLNAGEFSDAKDAIEKAVFLLNHTHKIPSIEEIIIREIRQSTEFESSFITVKFEIRPINAKVYFYDIPIGEPAFWADEWGIDTDAGVNMGMEDETIMILRAAYWFGRELNMVEEKRNKRRKP